MSMLSIYSYNNMGLEVQLGINLVNVDVIVQAQAIEERELEDKATALVEQATSSGSLQAFGNAHVLPKRIYTIDELRLNKIEPEKLLSPKDESLNGVRNIAQAAAFAGLGAVAYFSHFDVSKILGTVLATSFVLVFDQVSVNRQLLRRVLLFQG